MGGRARHAERLAAAAGNGRLETVQQGAVAAKRGRPPQQPACRHLAAAAARRRAGGEVPLADCYRGTGGMELGHCGSRHGDDVGERDSSRIAGGRGQPFTPGALASQPQLDVRRQLRRQRHTGRPVAAAAAAKREGGAPASPRCRVLTCSCPRPCCSCCLLLQALVDFPGQTRRVISFKRMALTDFTVDIPRLAKKSVLAKALEEAGE